MQNSDYFYKTKYYCKTYKEVLEYAKRAHWPLKGERRGFQNIKFPQSLLDNDFVLKHLSTSRFKLQKPQRRADGACLLVRLGPRTMFREHIDDGRSCALHLCLHHDHSHTFILPHDDRGKYLSTPFIEPDYEPGYFYLLNVSKLHGVLNCSDEPRYNGFFTLDSRLSYEETKRLYTSTTS